MKNQSGVIAVPVGKDEYKNVTWEATIQDKPTDFGLNGGRITRLNMKSDGTRIADYFYGWNVEPAEDDQAAQVALYVILAQYN